MSGRVGAIVIATSAMTVCLASFRTANADVPKHIVNRVSDQTAAAKISMSKWRSCPDNLCRFTVRYRSGSITKNYSIHTDTVSADSITLLANGLALYLGHATDQSSAIVFSIAQKPIWSNAGA